jgi:hypothetical protein
VAENEDFNIDPSCMDENNAESRQQQLEVD